MDFSAIKLFHDAAVAVEAGNAAAKRDADVIDLCSVSSHEDGRNSGRSSVVMGKPDSVRGENSLGSLLGRPLGRPDSRARVSDSTLIISQNLERDLERNYLERDLERDLALERIHSAREKIHQLRALYSPDPERRRLEKPLKQQHSKNKLNKLMKRRVRDSKSKSVSKSLSAQIDRHRKLTCEMERSQQMFARFLKESSQTGAFGLLPGGFALVSAFQAFQILNTEPGLPIDPQAQLLGAIQSKFDVLRDEVENTMFGNERLITGYFINI